MFILRLLAYNWKMSLVERVRGRWLRFKDTLPGAKGRTEFAFWANKKAQEGNLRNDHYRFLYTEHWDLPDEFYAGKKILDVGCGPRGSLEWADMAAERIGLDSLVNQYRKLGIDQHQMSYIACGIEKTPYPDGYFDVVASVNSLDHVDDLDAAIKEIKRLVKPGGLFLLLVEVNHPPTVCEPYTMGWDVVDKFKPEFEPTRIRHFENVTRHMRDSLTGPAYDHDNPEDRVGMLSAMLTRI